VNELTLRQWNVLTFILSYRAEYGYAPTYREISDGCDISSTSVVADDLDVLRARRLIRMRPDTCRTMVVLGGQAVGFAP